MLGRVWSGRLQPARTMKVITERVLADNYMYYVIDTATRNAFVVDLGDVSNVAAVARREEFRLEAALVTHHHWDHAQGAAELRRLQPAVRVYGGDADRIAGQTDAVRDGQTIRFHQLSVRCIATPGHTSSHVCYLVTDPLTDQKALFTGDTLFLAGCGKFFECPAAVMHDTLYNKLLPHVPDETEMYFGHEYSITNLKFAKEVEPTNTRITEKLESVKQAVNAGNVSTPSLWGDEKLYNPFLRVRETAVKLHCGLDDEVKVLDKLRSKKNSFRG